MPTTLIFKEEEQKEVKGAIYILIPAKQVNKRYGRQGIVISKEDNRNAV